jgi:hypothetical protein
LLARNTIWMLNFFSDWRPSNGLCLAWPSAARLADKHDPYPFNSSVLLDNFESALRTTMRNNFWPDLNGGGLEQVGATQAVNELLLQSFEGFLRLFAGWPLGEAASFTTLRAVGAFLVSAAVDVAGVVSDVTVHSERGRNCTVMNPFAFGLVVKDDGGRVVTTHDVGGGKFEFGSVAGTTYVVSSRGVHETALKTDDALVMSTTGVSHPSCAGTNPAMTVMN